MELNVGIPALPSRCCLGRDSISGAVVNEMRPAGGTYSSSKKWGCDQLGPLSNNSMGRQSAAPARMNSLPTRSQKIGLFRIKDANLLLTTLLHIVVRKHDSPHLEPGNNVLRKYENPIAANLLEPARPLRSSHLRAPPCPQWRRPRLSRMASRASLTCRS